MSSEVQDEWMPVEEAASLLHVTTRQVNRYGAGEAPKLRTKRVSRRVLYHRQDVFDLAQELNVDYKPLVKAEPKPELVPAGAMLEVFERQQAEIARLNRELGMVMSRLESQTHQLEDAEQARQRLDTLQLRLAEAEQRAALADEARQQLSGAIEETHQQLLAASVRAASAEQEAERLRLEQQHQTGAGQQTLAAEAERAHLEEERRKEAEAQAAVFEVERNRLQLELERRSRPWWRRLFE
jgi:hypothetical protein